MLEFLIFLPMVMLAVIPHEIAHGYVALRLGDPTAKNLGRLTFNPIKHVSLLGTIILPLVLVLVKAPFVFAWAKPVPVNPQYFRRPFRDMGLVAAAGPAVNFTIAALLAGLYRLISWGEAGVSEPTLVRSLLQTGVIVNLVLGTFNLLPIPPLDGSRIFAALLPVQWARVYARLERWGLVLVMALLYFHAVRWLIIPVAWMARMLLGEEISFS